MDSIRYIHTEDVHNLMAPRAIVPLIVDLIKPTSVIDVGCGLGTWLNVFNENGVSDYLGVDGVLAELKSLKVPADKIEVRDLNQPFGVNRKFDLALCLEVVEHLNASSSETIVNSLVNLSDVILFSAAIPGQGGQNHVNERWLSFWVGEFGKHGYLLQDSIRSQIWNNPQLEVWYRQNVVFFVKKEHAVQSKLEKLSSPFIDIVHPDLFAYSSTQAKRASSYEEGELGLDIAWRSFLKAIKNKLK